MRKAFILVSAMVLSACAGPAELMSKSIQITPGMTTQELQSLMGPPQNRQFSGTNEAWQYCATGAVSDDYLLVWVNSGTVTGLQTYKNTETGMCTSFFQTVEWEDAPDASIEIRQR